MGAAKSTLQASKHQVFISRLGAAYPTPLVDNSFLDDEILNTETGYEEQIAKLGAINKRTGIQSRPVVLDRKDPFYHSPEPFRIEKLTEIWLRHGIPLSHRACSAAIADWGGSSDDITHLVAATCTVQCHPGIDAYIAQRLDLHPNVNRTLLSGVGCAGGVALLRTAHELAMAMTCRGKPARVLVVACDLNSLGFRSDLHQLKQGRFPIGLALFGDAATAAVVSNGIASGRPESARHLFEIRQWMHYTIPNSLDELRLMPTSIGPVSTISKRLPGLIADAVSKTFFELLSSMPRLVGNDGRAYQGPGDFDWDIHPGGIGVFDRIIEVMGLTRNNITATVTAYENWGNSAGPTVLKVLDIRRTLPVKREYVVCCGFGNNIDITMLILRRR